MNINSIMTNLEETAIKVNGFILSTLEGNPKDLYAASSSYIRSGGKKLRPYMVIKSCEMFGGTEKKAIPAAAAVELVHNFSLIHDDIMDNDDIRHGIPTVHKKYGLPLALISGDILFSKAFQVLSIEGTTVGLEHEVITKMVTRLSTACVHVCEGQTLDTILATSDTIPTVEEYLYMIEKKTAALFDVSCAIGTLSSLNSMEKDVEKLSSFGRHVGIAFQLIDDLIGIAGDPKITGKAVGNDIREGKKTYPMILALEMADGDRKKEILNVFGNKNAHREEINDVVNMISSLNIDREVRKAASQHMKKAVMSIEKYVEDNAKKALISSARFIVHRSL